MHASLEPRPDDPKAAAARRSSAHAIGAASGMPLFLGARVQRKPSVGPANDVFEQEADQIAEAAANVTSSVGATGAVAGPISNAGSAADSPSDNSSERSRRSGRASVRTGRGGSDPPELGSATQAALSRCGGEDTLSASVRGPMEASFGADLGVVHIHADATAARAAQELNARAFTFGQDIFFGVGEYQPDTPPGRRLLAHELAHTLQQAPDLSPARAARLLPPDHAAEKDADAGAWAIDSGQAAHSTRASMPANLALQPQTAPPLSTVQLGAYLESDDPIARGSALEELAHRDDEPAWRALLLAQQSRNEDVRAEAQARIAYKIGQQPAFETFLRDLANSPHGALSDLAILALTAVGGGAGVDVENYRHVIHQRLVLARDYLGGLELQLSFIAIDLGIQPSAETPPGSTEIDTLEANADALPLDALWELGLRASTLLDQLAQIRTAAAQLQAQAGQFTQEGAVRTLANNQLMRLLLQARQLTGKEDDPAFADVLNALSSWPGRFACALLDDLYKQFTKTRSELADAMNREPLPSFTKAWNKFRETVMVPLLADLNTLILEIEFLQPEAAKNPDTAFAQLHVLETPLTSIEERVLYTLQATSMMDLYAHLAETDEEEKAVMYGTELDVKALFTMFAQMAYERDRDPEATQKRYQELTNSPEFKAVMEDIRDWDEKLAAEQAFLHFLLDVLIVIASIYTGGLAGGLVRGLFGTVASLGGRVAVGTLVFGADVTAFTLTSRGLRWAVYGEDLTKGLGGDLLKNALMFGVLKGSAAVYERFGAPLLPQALRPVGAMTSTFVTFQAWSVGLNLYETGEWIGGTDPRFWEMAAHNALFLGAIHLGMKITQPLIAPVQESMLDFQIKRHNQRCAALEAQIQTWTGAEHPAYQEGVGMLRRAQALYRERLEVLREINRLNPNELTDEEFQQADAVIRAQVQAVENTLIQSRFNLTAHETAPNTFYYEGNPEELRQNYERQGYEFLEVDAATGRVRLRSPDGQIIDLIRTRETPTETAGRTVQEAAAEQRIAAATTADAYLTALRLQPHRAGSAGVGWDYSRFPQRPSGRAGMWQVGDPIDMQDRNGVYPSFETARPRYWKNRAHFELQGRARGEARQDPTSRDPMRRMSDADLQALRNTGSAPPDPSQPSRTMELEHSGVPQRVEAWLQELGFSAGEARQLAEVSSPGGLLEVSPLEHAFFDVYASRFGAQRADIAGDVWSGTEDADIRLTRPMEPMGDATIARIVQAAQQRGYNFGKNRATQQLRAALAVEITARSLPIIPP